MNQKLLWRFGLGMIGAGLAAVLFRHENTEFVTAALGVLTMWLGLTPGVVFLASPPTRRLAYPLFALSGLFYAVFFGLPALLLNIDLMQFSRYFYHLPMPSTILPETQVLVIAGFTLAGVAYFVSSTKLFPASPRFKIHASNQEFGLVLLLWLLLISNLSYLFFDWVRSIPSAGQFLQPVGPLALAMFYVLWRLDRLSNLHAGIIGFVVLPLLVLKLVHNGFLTPIILLVVLYGAIEFWMRRRIPWKLFLIVAVLAIGSYQILGQIRSAVFWNTEETTIMEDIRKAKQLLSRFYKLDPEYLTSATEQTCTFTCYQGQIKRISHLVVFDITTRASPDRIPFWNGESYKPLLSSLIPRVLWKDKPKETFGNEFARRYGFVEETNRTLSLNVPWIVEMYVNFGKPGVLIGMTIMGLFAAFLERFFVSLEASPLEVVVGIAIILPIPFQESNLSVMIGSLVPLTVCLWIYFTAGFWVLRKSKGRAG